MDARLTKRPYEAPRLDDRGDIVVATLGAPVIDMETGFPPPNDKLPESDL